MTFSVLTEVTLAIMLPLLAWRAVIAPRPFEACVVFIVYGLLLALAWVLLGAVDVAIAEAAVGAGFAGAVLINALSTMGTTVDDENAPVRRWITWMRIGVCCAFAGALFGALVSLTPAELPAMTLLRERLADSGVSNPVTAVLLNFRALDTLLEVGVMWLAVVAAWSVLPAQSSGPLVTSAAPGLLRAAVGIIVPAALLVSVYLWWIGSAAPGGAFQGAAMLGGAAVAMTVVHRAPWLTRDRRALRVLVVAGFVCFLAVAVGAALEGHGRLLEYPPGKAYALIVFVEAVCMVSIGAGFGVLFAGRRAKGREESGA